MEWPRHTSRWWKNIVNLDMFGGQGWFNPEVVRRVGNSGKTSFWKINGMGRFLFTGSICVFFCFLFQIIKRLVWEN